MKDVKIIIDGKEYAVQMSDEQVKEIAQQERAQVLHDRLEQWQALNDKPVDWGGYKPKYIIEYDYYDKRLFVVANGSSRTIGTVYFSTCGKAQEAIKVFRDELMWYFTKYRSRLDEKRTEANTQT